MNKTYKQKLVNKIMLYKVLQFKIVVIFELIFQNISNVG